MHNRVEIVRTKGDGKSMRGFPFLFVLVPASCSLSAMNDRYFESIRVDNCNLFPLLPGIVYGVGCAALGFAVVYRNQNITVVNHVAIPDMIASSLVRIAYLNDAISPP